MMNYVAKGSHGTFHVNQLAHTYIHIHTVATQKLKHRYIFIRNHT